MTSCPECGLANDPSVVFCVSCGLFLEWEEEVTVEEVVEDPDLIDDEDRIAAMASSPLDDHADDDASENDNTPPERNGSESVRPPPPDPPGDPDQIIDMGFGDDGPGPSGTGPTMVATEQRRGIIRSVLDSLRGESDADGWIPADKQPSSDEADIAPQSHDVVEEDLPVFEPDDYDEDGDPHPVLPAAVEADATGAVPPPPAAVSGQVTAPLPPALGRPTTTVPAPPGLAPRIPDALAARLIVPLGANDMPTPLAQRRRRTPPVVSDEVAPTPAELGARAPGRQRERSGSTIVVSAPSRAVEPGDVICTHCGEANIPTRHFCRRCASPMTMVAAEPQVHAPWWRRFFAPPKEMAYDAGDRPDAGRGVGDPRWRIIWRRMKRIGRTVIRFAVVIILVSAVIVPFIPAAAPLRDRAILYLEDLGASARRFIAPQYVEVNPIEALASSSQSDHPPEAAADGFSNRYWAESATGDGVGQVLSIRFENPVDLDRVGFLNGGVAEGEEFISQPRPRQLTLIFSDGTQTDLELADDPAFQEFSITARGVDRVDILIEGVYGAVGGNDASISEVTFFRKQ